jgi:hypothetical protein
MATLAEAASELTARVRALEEKLLPKLVALEDTGEKLMEASLKVEESWSGSALGYHSELYYGEFEKPPLRSRFNPEWGGVNGLPPGWRARTPEAVRERIQELGGVNFSGLEKGVELVLNEAKVLHGEIVTEISSLHSMTGLDREKALLDKIEGFEWGKTINNYIHANVRRQAMTRDSRAISEGTRIPAHVYDQAVAYQAEEQCSAIRAFLIMSRRLLRQLELNAQNAIDGAGRQSTKVILNICDRFHLVAKQLTSRRENRATLAITDEYDVQDLFHALLRLHCDDIRQEEWTPSYGGGSSRMDFLLKEEQIVIELKMTRPGLDAKEVANQLTIDATRYREHQDCKTLICLVYDPRGFVKNPRGIERDLAKLSGNGLEVICIITP